jgi:hypothetical protein
MSPLAAARRADDVKIVEVSKPYLATPGLIDNHTSLTHGDELDLLIIGAGPAVCLPLMRPRVKVCLIWSSRRERLPTRFGNTRWDAQCSRRPTNWRCAQAALKPVREKPTREELLSHYIHFVLDHDLQHLTGEEVTEVVRVSDDLHHSNARSHGPW